MRKIEFSIDFNPVLGRIIQRLNRFMTLIEVDNEKAYAHLPNSGRLQTALHPGDQAYLRRCERNPLRKSAYSVFAVQHDGIIVIVDSQFSNILAREAIEQGLFDDMAGYHVVKENFMLDKDSRVRLDLLLEGNSEKFYMEVKSVTHAVNNIALFPDAPTARGRRHLMQLSSLSRRGFKAGLLFSVQRSDAKVLKPNVEVDPRFSELLRKAIKDGVKIFTLKAIFQPPKTIRLNANDPVFKL